MQQDTDHTSEMQKSPYYHITPPEHLILPPSSKLTLHKQQVQSKRAMKQKQKQVQEMYHDMDHGKNFAAEIIMPLSQTKSLTSSPITRRHTRQKPMPLTPPLF